MKKILLDCDNTLGMPRHPVDDTMAFYYLLGQSTKAELVGITSTFGNAFAAGTFECSRKMLEELGMGSMPQAKGAEAAKIPARMPPACWWSSLWNTRESFACWPSVR